MELTPAMRTARRASLAFFSAAAALSLGCAGRHTPTVDEAPYTGPALSLDTSGPNHVLVLSAPSGGYTLTVDRVLERSKSFDVFATIRTPDPRFLHTQSVVELRALVPLASTERLRVCARCLAPDDAGDAEYPVAVPLPPAR